MKRFSSLRKNRRNFSLLGMVPQVGILFAFALLSPYALADSEAVGRLTENCSSVFKSDQFKKIKVGKDEIRIDQLDDQNIAKYCAQNGFNEALLKFGSKHNELSSAEKDKLKKFSLRPGEEISLNKVGACEIAYESVRAINRELTAFGENICNKKAGIEDRVSSCLDVGDSQESCISKLKLSIEELETLGRNLSARDGPQKKLATFFGSVRESLDRVLSDYRTDGEVLNQLSVSDRQKTSIYSHPLFLRSINSADFNARNLDEYFAFIGKNGIASSVKSHTRRGNLPRYSFKKVDQAHLANEIIVAADFLDQYRERVNNLFEKTWSPKSQESLANYKERLSQIQASVRDAKGLGDSLKSYGPGAITAVQPLLNRGTQTGTNLGAAGGLTGVGTVATLGAAAALGSQIASGRSSGSLSDSLPKPQAPAPVAGVGGTKLTDSVFGNEDKSSPSNTNKLDTPETAEKTENAPAATTAMAPGSPVFSSGGSFLQPGMKPKNNRPSSSDASPVSAGKSEEPLKGFGGELLSGPPPKKVDTSGDVSSLLGQMKDLFNFDDTPPMPEGGDPFNDMGASSDLAANVGDDSLLPETSDYDSGGDYQQEGSRGRNYASKEEEILGEKSQMPSYLGGKETPLFKRVKTRHKLCMERGLVVLGLGKLPQ